jgi:hypothetical protein
LLDLEVTFVAEQLDACHCKSEQSLAVNAKKKRKFDILVAIIKKVYHFLPISLSS